MNDLSWFMYWAAVVGNVSGYITALFIFSCIFFPVAALAIASASSYADDEDTERRWKAFKRYLFPALVFFSLCNFIPSEKTLYMIAASEVGEEVLKTEEANKLRIILNDKLDEMLHDGDNQE